MPVTFDRIKKTGSNLIGMVKQSSKIAFKFNGKKMSIDEVDFSGILSSIIVKTDRGTAVKLAFAVNRNYPDKYVVITSSDTSLTAEEIIHEYSKRWDTECFYRICKETLGLESEFHCKSFESMIAHAAIVFLRYMPWNGLLEKKLTFAP